LTNSPLIATSIAAADLGNLSSEIRNIERAGADIIHVDVMDGVFVPNLTFGPWILEVIRSVSQIPIDCHLMVSRPQDWISVFAKAGADQITVHIESTFHIHRSIDEIRKLGKRVGVSFDPGNPVCLVEELLDWIDVVQVMSVEPGFSGQEFIVNTLGKVRRLYDLRQQRKYLIEVDGGVNAKNIASIRSAGADIFVLGSFIFSHTDLKSTITELKNKLK